MKGVQKSITLLSMTFVFVGCMVSDYCGQRNFDLKINQEVSIQNPNVTQAQCVWQFKAPPSSRILLRFTNYDVNDTSFFVVSLSNVTVYNVFMGEISSDFVIYQRLSVNPSVPRERAVKNEYIWVIFANRNFQEYQPPYEPSVFRLLVVALNETVDCKLDEFLCDTGLQCVSNNTRCDGIPDCNDFSDELGCSDSCMSTEIKCKQESNELCVSPINVCDSTRQCDDLRDEIGCAPSCGSHVIHLQQNKTHQLASPNAPASYPTNVKCVWLIRAPPGTSIYISTVNINLYSRATLTVGEGPLVDPTRIKWRRRGGTAPLAASVDGNDAWVTFEVDDIRWYHIPGDAHFILELSVLDLSVNCSGEYEVACDSGNQCVNQSNVCDGIFHCWDKSDELSCGDCHSSLLCPTPDGQTCLHKSLICDGIRHCADFADETLCFSFCGNERLIKLEDYPGKTYNLSSLGYPRSTSCLWVFTASPEYRILLEVKLQNTSTVDITTAGNGFDATNTSSQLRAFGGFLAPFVVASAGNSMWLTFIADTSPQRERSFWYQVSVYDDLVSCEEGKFKCKSSSLCIDGNLQCDGAHNCEDFSDEIGCDICNGQSTINITNDQVHILQANIEEATYSSYGGKTCVWQIFASEGHRIKLTVVELELIESPHAPGDLKPPDFVFSEGKQLLGSEPFYMNNNGFSKMTVTSKTNDVFVLFVSYFGSISRFTVELEQFETIECEEGKIVCPSGLACIPEHWLCDGTPQCPLLGDEIGCGNCSSDDYWCDGLCVKSLTEICDANPHCADSSDEINCLPCGESEIVLQNETAPSSPFLSPTNLMRAYTCYWLITADPNTEISFEFSVFKLALHQEGLQIGSGRDMVDRLSLVAVLKGTFTNVSVLVKASQAWAKLTSDSYTGKQFSGTIIQTDQNGVCRSDKFSCGDSVGIVCLSIVDKCTGYAVCRDRSDELGCGNCGSQNIHVRKGVTTLNSPLYPRDYPNGTTCTWRIFSTLSYTFAIKIIDFHLENGYDYVTFNTGDSPHLVEGLIITGIQTPIRRLDWREESVWVTFTSDTSVSFRGFSFLISRLNESNADCDEGNFDCGNGICIDSAAKCNGFNDCRNNRDEYDCDDVVCPGAYKCDRLDSLDSWSSTIAPSSSNTVISPHASPSPTAGYSATTRCVSMEKVCDGEFDCPGRDDETECDVKKCPAGCECNYQDGDLNVTCTNGWNSTLLSGVAATTNLLHLSGVTVTSIESGMFKALSHLKVLSLRNNAISTIKQQAFQSLRVLLWLDLSNTSLVELEEFTFWGMTSLQGITMFDLPLENIRNNAFVGLDRIETLILVRQRNDRLSFDRNSFDGLENLRDAYVDDHRICCKLTPTTTCKTLEPEPPLFMCSNLMPNLVLKISMWILGISALVGNIFVMIWRCREETEGRDSRKVHSLLVFNLAASDSLMGLYMLIVAIADVQFGNTYFEHSSEWQMSVPCRLAGFISIIASEASVFFLTLISIDRFLSIVFPLSRKHIRPKMGRIISSFIWIGTVIVGLVPTILASDSNSDLYGLSDVCIGLPLMTKVARYETRQKTIDAGGVANITVEIPYPAEYRASWFFSIALFLGVNLLCFCVILICYICIFASVKMSMKRVRRHKSRDDEVRMAIKMAAIVMTDFICWTPVIIMGILSQSRVVEIPPETYAWVVVFILPINSSLNPYLYTIADLFSQRRRTALAKKKDKNPKASNENLDNNSMETVFTSVPENKPNE